MELLNSACGVGIEREKDVHADDADEFASENVGESGDSLTPVVASAHVSGLLDPGIALLSSSESLLLERSTALLSSSESFISFVRPATFFFGRWSYPQGVRTLKTVSLPSGEYFQTDVLGGYLFCYSA